MLHGSPHPGVAGSELTRLLARFAGAPPSGTELAFAERLGPRGQLERRHLAVLGLFFAVAFLAFVVRTVAHLNGPPDGDLYAWNWSFQLLLMFGIFWLPLVIGCWAVVVVLAWAVRRDVS